MTDSEVKIAELEDKIDYLTSQLDEVKYELEMWQERYGGEDFECMGFTELDGSSEDCQGLECAIHALSNNINTRWPASDQCRYCYREDPYHHEYYKCIGFGDGERAKRCPREELSTEAWRKWPCYNKCPECHSEKNKSRSRTHDDKEKQG